jgi:acetate kinase
LGLAVLSRVLVVNAGSTSLKLALVDETGRPESIGSLVDVPVGIDAVGHRIVHGGDVYRDPVVVDDAVVDALERLTPLAPLHQAPALEALAAARAAAPAVPHVAVFDTAFHATLTEAASTYAVPRAWRDEWGVRRFGFHGIAVQSVAEQVDASRLVVCHLGGGCSVTAVLNGHSVDTTMGFTPLEGVPMATRSGSIDPGLVLYALRERGLGPDEVDEALERHSGLDALGGLDADLGFAVFVHRIAQAVAAMAVALGGVDAIAFSGGVGENREDVRRAVLDLVGFLGDPRVEVVPAREDLVIARAVMHLLASERVSRA